MNDEKTATFRKGERVSMTLFGEVKLGVVSRDQKGGIVWIRLNDSPERERWMHDVSLERVNA